MSTRARRAALGSVVVNGAIAAAKLGGGLFTGSAALLADGVHSTLDVLSSGVAYGGVRVARRPPDADHRYGHRKFEYFAGAVITGLLLLTGGVIALEAAERLLAPTPIRATTLGAAIAAVSLVANEGLAFVKTRVARDEAWFAIKVDSVHDHADAATSALVVVGLLAAGQGLVAADAVAALGVAVVVVWVGLRMGREAFDVLVDKAPPPELLRTMDRTVRAVPGVADAHALRARMVGTAVFVDLHIQVDPDISVEEGHRIAHRAEEALADAIRSDVEGPVQVVVHVEPEGDEPEEEAPPVP